MIDHGNPSKSIINSLTRHFIRCVISSTFIRYKYAVSWMDIIIRMMVVFLFVMNSVVVYMDGYRRFDFKIFPRCRLVCLYHRFFVGSPARYIVREMPFGWLPTIALQHLSGLICRVGQVRKARLWDVYKKRVK